MWAEHAEIGLHGTLPEKCPAETVPHRKTATCSRLESTLGPQEVHCKRGIRISVRTVGGATHTPPVATRRRAKDDYTMENAPNNHTRVWPNGQEVRRHRGEVQKTQQELADAAGVSKTTVENVERGKSCIWGTLVNIAAGFKRKFGRAVEAAELMESVVAGSALGLDDSGIARCFERLDRSDYAQLLKGCPAGPVVVINTWIENFRDISGMLADALRDDPGLSIELIQLKDDPEVIQPRAAELDRDVSSRIRGESERIRDFLAALKPAERERVQVLTIDFTPKFSLYAVGDSCLVGFFWPEKLAVNQPQLLVRGREGYFAREVWDYIAAVQRQAIPYVPPPPMKPRAKRKR